jgi:MEMO1 family protein
MANLPSLRRSLDVMPSPDEAQPGLVIRDPLGYSDGVLVCPPPLVPFLRFFDGAHEVRDLEAALRGGGAGERAEPLAAHLLDSLARVGLLDDAEFQRRRDEKHAAFARTALRAPAHAGSAYPEDTAQLRALLDDRIGPPAERETSGLVAIAAPHASPEGAWDSYRAAFRRLAPGLRERTFVILGTSHHGAPDRFGLTRKAYVTPLGATTPDVALVDELLANGGPAAIPEDYCHAVEHSIEFQVVFLQHMMGPGVRVAPVLCGPYTGKEEDARPEDEPGVARFLEVFRRMCVRERERIFFVLGVDMAHVGRRYGDRLSARAGRGVLKDVEHGDRARLARLAAGDASGFWTRVSFAGDSLNWCGTAPFYTFLRVAPRVRGELLHYEQWQIDPESVVSCAGLAFYAVDGEDE